MECWSRLKKFGETPLNYKKIYEKLEDKILNMIKTKKNVIVLGDFNYTNIFELFSNLKYKMKCVYEDENTRKKRLEIVFFEWQNNTL